jgi:DNA-binding transcriptional MerR regulator
MRMQEEERGQVEFLTSVAVARLARVSRESVRKWARDGWLRPSGLTTSGVRLFRREDVMRLLHERRERALARYSISEG